MPRRKKKWTKIHPVTGITGILLLGYVAVSPVFKGPGYLHRGVWSELTQLATGTTYAVNLRCPDKPIWRGHTLRAQDAGAAVTFVQSTFPGCKVTRVKRARRRVTF